jgi:glycogen debranching enzyme
MLNERLQPTAEAADDDAQAPFYIRATSAPSRRRLSLKHGNTFAIFDDHGDIGVSAGGGDGLFHNDTRHLSRLELLINGTQPLLLGASLRDDNAILRVDLTSPDIFVERRASLTKNTIHIVRTIFLWRGTAYYRFGIQNHSTHPVELDLSLCFTSDFADVFEVRGLRRRRRGSAQAKIAGPGKVTYDYKGLDSVERRTDLEFEPAPQKLEHGRAEYRLNLAPGNRTSIYLAISCNAFAEKPMPFLRGMRAATHELRAAVAPVATVETSNDILNEVLCRSMADLTMLCTQTPQGTYPDAGVPWFSTTFGRDGLVTAIEMLECAPDLARGVLRRLAAFQAKETDPVTEAEPGKILHEMRQGEMAALHEIPFGLYYGSVDSTPLFVMLAGLYVERTGDVAMLHELWPNIRAALSWIDGPGDPDRDGFIEYRASETQGLVNQGWKDSNDAVFHADGRLAEGPIALAEVQGYVFAAKRLAARCASRMGDEAMAHRLSQEAELLARRFDEAFWCPQIGTYALALDGAKQQCRVRTSNAGQALFTGIARPDRARDVVSSLMQPSMFSGWGIRTVSSEELRYNPMSYHNGSIWPHDNALIGLGFARYGYKQAVDRVFQGMFDAARYMDLFRLPELFCGFRRGRGQGPTLYPVACAPQAWSCVSLFALLHAALGLEFKPDQREIRLWNPRLPRFIDHVTLRKVQFADSSVDLAIRRHETGVAVHVLRLDGNVHVSAIYS